MKTFRQLVLTALAAGVVAWCAEARYKPSNFDTFPELPVTGVNAAYVSLTEANYKVEGGAHVIKETCSSGGQPIGALRIEPTSPNTTVTLWIDNGGESVSITATGADAVNGKGGGAGIYLPEGVTLILRRVDDGTNRNVTVTAAGGAGADASSGAAGGDASSGNYGDGGAGGAGACAAGAGIGGYGGSGGSGGAGVTEYMADGNPGSDGEAGGTAGTLIVFDGIVVTASAGRNGYEKSVPAAGGEPWGGQGGGGAGGGGGASGPSAKIGGSGGGGGGGGSGGGAYNHGGNGGGGGGKGGGGGSGGTAANGSTDGAAGSASTGDDGGAGGKKSVAGEDAGYGGAGGSIGAGGGAGKVLCYATELINNGTTGSSDGSKGVGKPSSLTSNAVRLDFCCDDVTTPAGQSAADTYTILSSGNRPLFNVQPPSRAGYGFAGYFDRDGAQMFYGNGAYVPGAVASDASTFYARWEVVVPVPADADVTYDRSNRTAMATWNTLPANQKTFGTWYYRAKEPQGDWHEYAGGEWSSVQPLVANGSSTINPVNPSFDASGEYEFRFELVSVCDGTGLAATNSAETIAVFDYVLRKEPTYDARTKTVYANGSALRVCRDVRDADRVIVYYDQEWDNVYEGALSRAYDLGDGGWLNGSFKNGQQVGGGVRIWVESGHVYGVDMGANVVGEKKLTTNETAVVERVVNLE